MLILIVHRMKFKIASCPWNSGQNCTQTSARGSLGGIKDGSGDLRNVGSRGFMGFKGWGQDGVGCLGMCGDLGGVRYGV